MEEVEKFVGPLVAIFIGVALIPVVSTYISSANITDTATKTLITLIPFFYGLSVFLYTIKGIVF
jgi:hypothetical protein